MFTIESATSAQRLSMRSLMLVSACVCSACSGSSSRDSNPVDAGRGVGQPGLLALA